MVLSENWTMLPAHTSKAVNVGREDMPGLEEAKDARISNWTFEKLRVWIPMQCHKHWDTVSAEHLSTRLSAAILQEQDLRHRTL
jgi:hypothetical protein